ncbi:MAG: ATP-binding protein [Candidatus Microsaccharimonas sp.]
MDVGSTKYSQQTTNAVRIIGLVAIFFYSAYALLISLQLIPNSYNAPVIATVIFLALWIIIDLYYYYHPIRSKRERGVRLILIHVFALVSFIFITGFIQPFVPLFVLLFLASHIYYGRFGLVVSIVLFLIGLTLDILLRAETIPHILINDVMTGAVVIFLGLATIGVVSAQETKRRSLLHSQERERLQYDRMVTIMNNLTDAAFTTNQNGVIIMYNAACLDLLDTNSSLKGKNIGDLFQLTNSDDEHIDLSKLLKDTKRSTRRDDLNHIYSDGEVIRLEITFAPIRSSYSVNKRKDEQGGYIIIMRDVTKQKSLEEERDEFISVVSHELRTPITIVEGTLSNIEVLMNRSTPSDPKVLAQSITTAHDQVLYLARMVNDLSTLSRAERGVADKPELIDVAELLHTMHHRYEKEAEARQLHLNLDMGSKLGSINVSRLYVEELLQNFITNAIKYTKKGSVTIIAKRTKDTVRFTVKDTGIGISRSDQNKVFSKFYRSEDYRIRETNGTGLGLYVSTKLAHKLHTHIELQSRLNHGSSFSFELPVE